MAQILLHCIGQCLLCCVSDMFTLVSFSSRLVDGSFFLPCGPGSRHASCILY